MATLRDVANAASVSSTTASRVLNADPSLVVPDETRERVLRAAHDLAYHVKSKRREIGRNSIHRIGILAYKNEEYVRSDPYFQSIRRGVEAECGLLGFSENVVFSGATYPSDYNKLEGVDGLVVIGDVPDAVEYFRDRGQHIVFVDTCPDPNRYNSVVVDFDHATKMVLDHLLSLGHQRIGHIGGPVFHKRIPDARQKAFRQYLSERGLLNDRDVHLADDWTSNDGHQVAQRCIAQGDLPEAFFIASDPLAIGVIRALLEAGYRVPEDVAIVSFDDIEMAPFVTPPLSTIHVPTEKMGRVAVDMLVDGVGTHQIPLKVTVPTRLVIRESCGAKPVRVKQEVVG